MTTAEAPQRWAYTPEEFAEKTGSPVQTVREMCRDGRIAARRMGRRWFIPHAEVERLMGTLGPESVVSSRQRDERTEQLASLRRTAERLLQQIAELEGQDG